LSANAPVAIGTPEGSSGPQRGRPAPSKVARIAASGALLCAVVLVAVIVLSGGSSYTLHIVFSNASGLVTGDDVLIGPARIGTVNSIGLTRGGQAAVQISIGSDAAPAHQGTVARIEDSGLAALAGHYIVLYPGPASNPPIPSGGSIPQRDAYSEVSLDQVFDALDPLTRAGIRGVVRGEAASIKGRARAANRTLEYLDPALVSTSDVTAQLSRSEPAFDRLLVDGAQTLQRLASRSEQLSELIANTNRTTAAIASQSRELEEALSLLPGALQRSTTTFAGLRTTLDDLDPLVQASKPADRRLGAFAAALRKLAVASVPTLGELSDLIHNPAGTGDLTQLLLQTPALARLAATAFPKLIEEMNDSQSQVDYLREYAPDVVAALTDLGQAGGYYDANGHYERTQPVFDAFGLDASNELTQQSPADRYNGLQVVHGRCPGSAVQPPPDGSAPESVPGCNTSATPPGP
jgi:phospholipid/cholesterol/gamma-HCH transport system substrate-binding protein